MARELLLPSFLPSFLHNPLLRKPFRLLLFFFSLLLFLSPPPLAAQVSCTADKGKVGAAPGHKCIQALAPNISLSWEGPTTQGLLSSMVVSPGTSPTTPDETAVESLLGGSGTVSPMSGQEIQGFQVTATAGKGPGGGFTLWGWYGSKSSFEPYAKLFEGARMWGDIWKNNTEDYLVNPQPGEPVTRICPYGLKVVTEYTEILVSHPLQQWNGTPSSFLFKFQYDPQGRLTSVIYPQRQFTYDANHDLDYDAGEDYDACPAIGFAYDQVGGYTRITTVYNEIWAAGKSQSRLLQETLLSIGFDGTYEPVKWHWWILLKSQERADVF